MRNAIGMVELTSIARGIETCDYMVKAAQVDLIRSSTVCPGKYIILIAGDTGDVKASMAEGIRQGGEYVVNTLLLPNVHPQLRPPGPLFQSYQALGNMPSQIHSCSVRGGVCAARSQSYSDTGLVGHLLHSGGKGLAGGFAGGLAAGEQSAAEVGLGRGRIEHACTSAAFRAASTPYMASRGGAIR